MSYLTSSYVNGSKRLLVNTKKSPHCLRMTASILATYPRPCPPLQRYLWISVRVVALAPGLVLVWPCPRASSCRDGEDDNVLPQLARRSKAAGARGNNLAVLCFVLMEGRRRRGFTNAPPLGLTGWLTDCHRQLLEVSVLMLTVLAAETRRRRRGMLTSRGGRGVHWFLVVGKKRSRMNLEMPVFSNAHKIYTAFSSYFRKDLLDLNLKSC